MTRKKVVAAKEHKMLNEAKKYIKEQYILEPDEQDEVIGNVHENPELLEVEDD